MKKKNGPSEIKFLSLLMLSLVIMYSCFVYHNYYIYNSIKLVAKKNAAIEYGSANYKVEDFIKIAPYPVRVHFGGDVIRTKHRLAVRFRRTGNYGHEL